MNIDISAGWVAAQLAPVYVDRYLPGLRDEDRAVNIEVAKYNILAGSKIASSVLIVTAAVYAVFLSFTVAFVLGAAGLFSRWAVEKDEMAYFHSRPIRGGGSIGDRADLIFAHAAGILSGDEEDRVLFAHLKISEPPRWKETKHSIRVFGYQLWQNMVPLPGARQQ